MIGFNNGGIIFDSRGTTNNGFAIYAGSINDNGDSVPAYKNKMQSILIQMEQKINILIIMI